MTKCSVCDVKRRTISVHCHVLVSVFKGQDEAMTRWMLPAERDTRKPTETYRCRLTALREVDYTVEIRENALQLVCLQAERWADAVLLLDKALGPIPSL